MSLEEESFAETLSLKVPLVSMRPKRSYRIDCITPDKQPKIQEIMSNSPDFESSISKVWKNDCSDNYFVLNKANKDLYLICVQDINECMEGLQWYYTKLSVEIFEVLIKYNFNIGNTIAELMWRYQ